LNRMKNNIMKRSIGFVGFLGLMLILLAGCKHTEKVVIEKKIKPVSVRRLVRMVNENELKYNTLSVKKVNLTINNDGNVNTIKGFYKIRRDSIIQVSAQWLAIPIGKLELDPDSFRLVYHREKLKMSGLIQKIGDLVGYDIDYQVFQSILSNQLQSIKQDPTKENQFKDFVLGIEENMYKISSIRERRFRKFSTNEEKFERFKQRKDEQHLVKQDIFIDPDIFVVRKLVFSDIDSGRIITIVFSEFKPLGGKWFPGKIHVALSGKEKLDLLVELSKVSIDDEKDFGFSIPSKYKRQDLEKVKF
jgi:hypothetical protein